ncbi:hypothetical protein WN51_12333 [Melipona quadrifasciata]|uniref:Uncharacterized protein n=1 Tax=Melipona quadrifasciata TaxID=166423 RepID=A0A0M9A4Q8_9HYME|nr:hypothetical protein WN51_12333 [Melipona quadrifasciata]
MAELQISRFVVLLAHLMVVLVLAQNPIEEKTTFEAAFQVICGKDCTLEATFELHYTQISLYYSGLISRYNADATKISDWLIWVTVDVVAFSDEYRMPDENSPLYRLTATQFDLQQTAMGSLILAISVRKQITGAIAQYQTTPLLLEVYATPPGESRDSNQPIANFRCISVAPEEARFSGLPPLKSLSFSDKINRELIANVGRTVNDGIWFERRCEEEEEREEEVRVANEANVAVWLTI